jgi:uncharacterized protein (DUF427 family)
MESVWDYPRPPRIEAVPKRLEVVFAGRTIALTMRGLRVLETSHPPVYYFPPTDVETAALAKTAGTSWCEFKGMAFYWSLHLDDKSADRAVWSYPNPIEAYSELAGFFAFYASKMDKCFVGDQLVRPQQGDFYGGWITEDLTGPFKGAPGSASW